MLALGARNLFDDRYILADSLPERGRGVFVSEHVRYYDGRPHGGH